MLVVAVMWGGSAVSKSTAGGTASLTDDVTSLHIIVGVGVTMMGFRG